MNLTRLFKIIKVRKKQIISYSILTSLLVFMVGSTMLQYEATAKVEIRPLGNDIVDNPANPQVGVLSSPVMMSILMDWRNSYINLMTSRDVIEEVARLSSLNKASNSKGLSAIQFTEKLKNFLRIIFYGRPPVSGTENNRKLENLKKQISVNFMYNSSSLIVTVKDPDPFNAVNITNNLLEVFLKHSQKRTIDSAKQTQEFVEGQLSLTRNKIVTEKVKQIDLKEKYGLHSSKDVAEEQARVLKKLNSLEDQYENNQKQIKVLRKRIEHINQKLIKQQEYQRSSYTLSNNQDIQKLKQQLFNLKIKKEKLLIDYRPENLQVKTIVNEISMIENKIDSELNKILEQEVFQINPINQTLVKDKITNEFELKHLPIINKLHKKQIKKYRSRLSSLDIILSQIEKSYLILASLRNQEDTLIQYLNKAILVAARGASEVKILEKAHKPRYPILNGAPLIFYAFFSFILTLFLSSGIFALQSELKGLILEKSDILELDSSRPLFFSSSYDRKKRFLPTFTKKTENGTESSLYNQEQSLLDLTHFAVKLSHGPLNKINGNQCIGIISARKFPHDSTMAFDFGKALVEIGNRVVVIEQEYLLKNQQRFLKEYRNKNLKGDSIPKTEITIDDLVNSSNINNLYFIQWKAESRNSQSASYQFKFSDLLKSLKTSFDLIIIDIPPILENPESVLFTGLKEISGSIVSLKKMHSKKDDVEQLLQEIEYSGGKIFAYFLL